MKPSTSATASLAEAAALAIAFIEATYEVVKAFAFTSFASSTGNPRSYGFRIAESSVSIS